MPKAVSMAVSRRQLLAWGATSPWLAWPCTGSAAQDRVQLASPWPADRSPQGYKVSEKLDGVRAVWDGRVLRFRSGRVLAAPAWFLSALPALPLDGELWGGRGQFDRTSGIVRKARPDDSEWQSLTYQVFDAWGHQAVFAERVGILAQAVAAAQQPWLQALSHTEVADAAALMARLQQVVAAGGEGLVLHRADAVWSSGRSDALFKLKLVADDEAQVVGYQEGQGRLKGLTGALKVEDAQGRRFELGTGLSHAQRRQPPPVGAWVTYRYRDRTPSGLPRFASFVRVREAE